MSAAKQAKPIIRGTTARQVRLVGTVRNENGMSNRAQILRPIERSVGRRGVINSVDQEILPGPHRPGMFHVSHCRCTVPFLTFNRSQVPEENQDDGGGQSGREQANG